MKLRKKPHAPPHHSPPQYITEPLISIHDYSRSSTNKHFSDYYPTPQHVMLSMHIPPHSCSEIHWKILLDNSGSQISCAQFSSHKKLILLYKPSLSSNTSKQNLHHCTCNHIHPYRISRPGSTPWHDANIQYCITICDGCLIRCPIDCSSESHWVVGCLPQSLTTLSELASTYNITTKKFLMTIPMAQN